MRIAVIGGGSVYTPQLAKGLIVHRTALPVEELVLVDVPEGRERQGIVARFLRRMFRAAGAPIRVRTTEHRREAIRGAAFVLNQFRVGGMEARAKDERVPLAHGIVGQETIGPGGFSLALRTIPLALQVAEDVLEVSPTAWVLNFTNPSGMVTEALIRHRPPLRTLGLCNIPLAFQREVAAVLGVPPGRVALRMIGLNHLSWGKLFLDGKDITEAILTSPQGIKALTGDIPGLAPESPEFQAYLIFLRRVGMIPNPYLRYYIFPEVMFQDARRRAEKEGTRAEIVQGLEATLLRRYQDKERVEVPPELEKRGGAWYSDAAVAVMEALWTGRAVVQVVNVPNQGATPDMPATAVLEVDAVVGPDGVQPLAHGPLPPQIRGLVQTVKAYEQLTIEAAVTGDRDTALAALTVHPLVPGVGVARRLMDDLLRAQRPFLPAFFLRDRRMGGAR